MFVLNVRPQITFADVLSAKLAFVARTWGGAVRRRLNFGLVPGKFSIPCSIEHGFHEIRRGFKNQLYSRDLQLVVYATRKREMPDGFQFVHGGSPFRKG